MSELYRKKPVVIEAVQFHKLGDHPAVVADSASPTGFGIHTLEHTGIKHEVTLEDWIITGVKGEVYACKPDIFAVTYEPALIGQNLTFGAAVEALKIGKKVARAGWNGKDMYLWLLPAALINRAWIKDPMLLEVFGDREELDMLGSIRMKTATGGVLTGWLASQTDILAEDWLIVD